MYKNIIKKIEPVNLELIEKAQERLDNLTKPPSSLGRLEDFARRVVSISGNLRPSIGKKYVFTFAGDHGVTEEGVSAFPKDVTAQMVFNFLKGGAAINVLARHEGAEVVVVDVGVDFDFKDFSDDNFLKKKVVWGTKNMAKEPALSRVETIKCIEVGMAVAQEYATEGAIFATGEMGIGNTTPASAIASYYTGLSAREVTGRGTGIDDLAVDRKVSAIESSLEVLKASENPQETIEVLRHIGGAEIAAIAGLILGASANKVPVVIDGFISTAAAVIALKLCPHTAGYMFASHKSVEVGHESLLEILGLKAMFDFNMRLGEGTGAVLGINMVEAGLKIYNEMATFSEAGVSEKSETADI